MNHADRRSPVVWFLLVFLVHLALWLALGFEILVAIPRMKKTFSEFGVQLDPATAVLLQVSDLLASQVYLLAVPLAVDGLVLFVLCFVLPISALRRLWSSLVLALLLAMILWGLVSYWWTTTQILEGLSR
jgi:hypothetical protein